MPVPYIYAKLLNYIKNSFVSTSNTLLYDLAAQIVSLDVYQPSQNYLELVEYLVNRIFTHPFTEKKNVNVSDKVLIGLLKLSDNIFYYFPEYKEQIFDDEKIKKFFKEILFPDGLLFENLEYDLNYLQNDSHFQPPKAKLKETRIAAYKLLVTLGSNSVSITNSLLNCLVEVKNKTKPIKS